MPEDLNKKITENDYEEIIDNKDDKEPKHEKIKTANEGKKKDDSEETAKTETLGIP